MEARVMLSGSRCDGGSHVLATSVYLLNHLPTKALQLKTPLQFLSAQAQIPVALTLQPRVFGCSVYVHIPKPNRDKLSPCAVKCVFVGYGLHQKGYCCYDPKTRHVYTTMNCDFLESEYFYHHLSRQGETTRESDSDSDSLSWLSMPMPSSVQSTGPTDEVSSTAEPTLETIQSTELETNAKTSPPLLISEVSPTPETVETCSVLETDNDRINDQNMEEEDCHPVEELETIGETSRYILSPRSTRGVPPKRFSPDHTGRKTKYPLRKKIEGGIVEFPFVKSEDQLTDILTKAVNTTSFAEVLSKLSIGDSVTKLEREC
ncbi:hypothetical protein C2S51_029010 [Perilla frutescens var. frutescens]|nr:hypothetical protein C2S51_029010 [Perilla frutescens var. frutescens]